MDEMGERSDEEQCRPGRAEKKEDADGSDRKIEKGKMQCVAVFEIEFSGVVLSYEVKEKVDIGTEREKNPDDEQKNARRRMKRSAYEQSGQYADSDVEKHKGFDINILFQVDGFLETAEFGEEKSVLFE
jgi:hypothetical protein